MKVFTVVLSLAMISCSGLVGMERNRQIAQLDDNKLKEQLIANQLRSLIQEKPLHTRDRENALKCITLNTDESGKISWPNVKNGLNNLGNAKPFSIKQAGLLTALSLCNLMYGTSQLMDFNEQDNDRGCIGDLRMVKVAAYAFYLYHFFYMLNRVSNLSGSKDLYSKPLRSQTFRFDDIVPVAITPFLMLTKTSVICSPSEGSVHLRNGWNSIETFLAAATLIGHYINVANVCEWARFEEQDEKNLKAFHQEATEMIDKEINK